MDVMLVDCTVCAVRGPACTDCVVSALLGVPDAAGDALAADEVRALDAMACGGLLPPLRLVHAVARIEPETWAPAASRRPTRSGSVG